MKRLVSLAVLLCSVMTVQAAPSYIQFKPLADVVKTPVGNVSSDKILPIITWGGDVATIYGNGNQRKTKAGSIFAQNGLDLKLVREDDFVQQVKNYKAGKTPFLRGTMGMINTAADVLGANDATKPVVFYQLTWSNGGDALVVKNNIKTVKDLKGKTIAVQAYGPHVDYLATVLKTAGLKKSDVKIKWVADLTATANSPMEAFYESEIDAAFVIIPDGLALTSGGNVGTGSEDSVKGAHILMSTRSASRVIADVYAVRNDYYQANKSKVHKLAKALMESEEALNKLVTNRSAQGGAYKAIMTASADILLDAPDATADAEGLFLDCEFAHFSGNVKFFTNRKNPRNFEKLTSEIQASLKQFGLITGKNMPMKSNINYKHLITGLTKTATADTKRFNQAEVAALVTKKQQSRSLDDGELFSFETFFKPNQKAFSADLYRADFKRVVELASIYAGAIITVEGHSDPMGYLRSKKNGEPSVVLGQVKQSAKNLSASRAQSVRDAILSYAKNAGISLDVSQFTTIGHGISQPNTGVCGSDPCAPATEKEWLSNMRVEFRIIQVEAESSVFMPL